MPHCSRGTPAGFESRPAVHHLRHRIEHLPPLPRETQLATRAGLIYTFPLPPAFFMPQDYPDRVLNWQRQNQPGNTILSNTLGVN
jgi:hypothetical protein